MALTYRTKRRMQNIFTIVLTLLLIFIVFWFCWMVWLERFVVYTRDNEAILDLEFNANEMVGEVAQPPSSGGTGVTIYYNEGDNAVEVTNEMTQLDGYYIDANMLMDRMSEVWENLDNLSPGTPVMIELKGGYGSFYYSSSLGDAIQSESVSVASVDELIAELKRRGFYTIAKVSAFRDYNFGLNHVNSGLPVAGKQYLWSDDGGCYWLNPTDATTLDWIASIVKELQNLDFNEVVLSDFRFPAGENYTFRSDKDEALQAAAISLLNTCTDPTFTLSFCVENAAFPLPEGRSRIYLENVGANNVGGVASLATVTNPVVRVVFLSANNDTRYNEYSVLRPLDSSGALEAQKADMAD